MHERFLVSKFTCVNKRSQKHVSGSHPLPSVLFASCQRNFVLQKFRQCDLSLWHNFVKRNCFTCKRAISSRYPRNFVGAYELILRTFPKIKRTLLYILELTVRFQLFKRRIVIPEDWITSSYCLSTVHECAQSVASVKRESKTKKSRAFGTRELILLTFNVFLSLIY